MVGIPAEQWACNTPRTTLTNLLKPETSAETVDIPPTALLEGVSLMYSRGSLSKQ